MIDLDVVRNGFTVTLLHWYQPDITLTSDLVLNAPSANASPGASYIGPAPPPGNPHRYNFLLFSQPAGFAVPESFSNINLPTGVQDRIGFQITEFVAAAGLDAPLAGAYFTVVNATGTASSTGSPAQTSPVQFEGVGSTMNSSMWTDVGLAVVMTAVAASLWAA
jgi:phosphatidylethanolamine-binding protein